LMVVFAAYYKYCLLRDLGSGNFAEKSIGLF
jgi:hypothetical protein